MQPPVQRKLQLTTRPDQSLLKTILSQRRAPAARGRAAVAALAITLLVACGGAQAKAPDGWGFVDFNEAVRLSKQSKRPMFVYFGFETCPYCLYLNQHTFASEELRKRYSEHYVLGYFDIRGKPNDLITLHNGDMLTRASAIKRLKGSPVPAWMFIDAEGKEILMRRGSRTAVEAFVLFDLYVSSGDYRHTSFEDFLARRGVREEKLE